MQKTPLSFCSLQHFKNISAQHVKEETLIKE